MIITDLDWLDNCAVWTLQVNDIP